MTRFLAVAGVAVCLGAFGCGAKKGKTRDASAVPVVPVCPAPPVPDPQPTPPVTTPPVTTPEPPVAAQLSLFEKDIRPILVKNCGGCHSEGAKSVVFVDDEQAFRDLADKVVERLTTDEPKLIMPRPFYRLPLSDAEKGALMHFLGH